jgi:branched-chain amino acid transport system substrate-binding protein
MQRRSLIRSACGAAAALALPGLALGQTRPLKIGQLTDYTGPYRDTNGPAEEYSIQLAIQDFNGGRVLGRPVELIVADNLNKADVASDIAKRWLEVEKVDMMVCSGSSVAALAAHGLARDKGVVTNMTSTAATNFTEQDCSPFGFHWQLDTYAYPRAAVMSAGEHAPKKWFFIAIDNVVGQSGTAVATAAIQEAGGTVVGAVKHPINTTDFASYISQAQASKADVVCFMSAGADVIRALKQAREFGLQAGGQVAVVPILVYSDIIAMGLEVAQGLRYGEGFYWDLNDASRAFARRFLDKIGRAPAGSHAQAYAAVTHYLQAVEAAKSAEGKDVAARMRTLPIATHFWTNTAIRPNGRVTYDVNLMRVKKPSQSKGRFDTSEVLGTVAGDKVFKPLAQTECKRI